VHKFILVNRCSNFQSILANIPSDNVEPPVLELPDIHPQILDQVLQYVYTNDCDLLKSGAKFVLKYSSAKSVLNDEPGIFEMQEDFETIKGKSAFEVVSKKGAKSAKSCEKVKMETNPLKLMSEIGKRWGIKGLNKR